MSKVKFFVYGSFAEGMVHFSKIKDFIVSNQPAQIRGSVFRLQVGFPVILEQGHSMIKGQLVELEGTELLYNLLDQFHGYDSMKLDKSLYLKNEINVLLADGQVDRAFCYFLNPTKLPKTAVAIEDGDWERSLKDIPVATTLLNERQKTYIKRLGRSTGRDIVPIEIDLYRELMNLGIVRDKGRRLALTKFGTEVFRYLE